jgi:hypothetical protein
MREVTFYTYRKQTAALCTYIISVNDVGDINIM